SISKHYAFVGGDLASRVDTSCTAFVILVPVPRSQAQGFDLLTGVFMLTPLALLDRRPGVTPGAILRNWGWVFLGNFAGALTVAVMMAFV
ncbi:formate/nitrite transporter family protein, partial [Escherichia ruysiae]|uniref:formate/nitrite transporter family protein n=1 Tax=Escherichia ruysiae TaxID=2608867 RepID=UPI003DA649B7